MEWLEIHYFEVQPVRSPTTPPPPDDIYSVNERERKVARLFSEQL